MTSELSAYDRSVPGPPADPALAQRFAALRGLRQADPARLQVVRRVVLVVSSSRSGSTMLAELLRGIPELLSLPGEVNPYVAVAQLDAAAPGRTAAAELAADLGSPPAVLGPGDLDDLVSGCRWRLAVQWPGVDLEGEAVDRAVRAAVREVRTWSVEGRARFTAGVLRRLRHPGLDPARYDVPGAGAATGEAGPPHPRLVLEMPPYRLLGPWRTATAADLAERTLVVATPRNSYRLPWLRALFPAAQVQVLHLVRNPAASVNGLRDGWRHPGFFNAAMPEPLAISGYSDPAKPWTRRWWKFDVPPCWRRLTRASLEAVCAEQWVSAHAAVLADRSDDEPDLLRVRYEDLVGDPTTRAGVAEVVADWLGLAAPELLGRAMLAGVEPQMATAPGGPARWRRHEAELLPVLGGDGVGALAERLGYGTDPSCWR